MMAQLHPRRRVPVPVGVQQFPRRDDEIRCLTIPVSNSTNIILRTNIPPFEPHCHSICIPDSPQSDKDVISVARALKRKLANRHVPHIIRAILHYAQYEVKAVQRFETTLMAHRLPRHWYHLPHGSPRIKGVDIVLECGPRLEVGADLGMGVFPEPLQTCAQMGDPGRGVDLAPRGQLTGRFCDGCYVFQLPVKPDMAFRDHAEPSMDEFLAAAFRPGSYFTPLLQLASTGIRHYSDAWLHIVFESLVDADAI